ncbi:MAG: hypothetical protein GQ574_13105 [Crocinitomix sp.]|nr:hypothetical protein [Crocinitomix sp.]
MRLILIFTASILLSITSYGQKKWQKIDQSGYGMKYELPKDWEIDGFSTSSVCHCAGTINSVNRFSKNEILMVAYPALSDSALYNGMRTEAWDWKFAENDERTTYKAKSLTFEKTVSKWMPESPQDDYDEYEGYEVWRFTTAFKNQHYVIYFWAAEKVLSKNEKRLLEVLNRFKAVKVGSNSEYW